MARYDVYRDPRGSENLLLCVQSDLIEQFDTRVAVPLIPQPPLNTPVKKLNPIFVIEDRRYVMHTQLILAVPASAFTNRIANVAEHRDEITAALDMLFQGF